MGEVDFGRGDAVLVGRTDPRLVICELCRRFHAMGWASGTGGGISVREGDRIWVAPSGVQKELVGPDDLFAVDLEGRVLVAPVGDLRPSACTPLFLHAYRERDAGAVIHSHGMYAMLATLVTPGPELRTRGLEMQKGIAGHEMRDELVVPILENTPREHELADGIRDAMRAYPRTHAVLVRGHGVYVWGRDWASAKTQAECYDYLFRAVVETRRLGLTL